MSPTPNITQEIWTVATAKTYDDPAPYVFRFTGGPREGPAEGEMVAKVLDIPGSRARADMMARAPTMYRLLESVLRVCDVPADLLEIIEINLYRAAPEHRSKPVLLPIERKNAWEKLLEDDLVLP